MTTKFQIQWDYYEDIMATSINIAEHYSIYYTKHYTVCYIV